MSSGGGRLSFTPAVLLLPVALPDMQVDLPKPLGLKFARGSDGGAYVVTNDPQIGNTDPRIQVCVCVCVRSCVAGVGSCVRQHRGIGASLIEH